jgi:hypothetical protein
MQPTLTGWYVGFIIAAVVIVIVVVMVALILSLVRRISLIAADIVLALDDIRKNTTSVPAISTLNTGLGSVVDHAATARKALGG